MTTQQQVQAMAKIIAAIIDTIKEAGPLGAPCSSVYLALQAHGATLDQYNTIEFALIKAGKIRKEHSCLFTV